MTETPLAQLIGERLGRDLGDHVVDARNAGHGWRRIATDIKTLTGVTVSWETLRVWFTNDLVTVTVLARSKRPASSNRRAS